MLPVTDSTRMPMGFVKIYGDRLIKSSLWDENPEARLVFLSMLAIADQYGIVDCPNTRVLARYLNLKPAFLKSGLAVLEAPDPGSRSPDEEGRRVVFEGNRWRLVNYANYREYRTERQENTRLRVQKHRAGKDTSNTGNTRNKSVAPVRTEAEAEAEAEGEGEKAERLLPHIVMHVLRVAVEKHQPQNGMWNPGRFADKTAREWCENVPLEHREAALEMLPDKAEAFAKMTDEWIRKRGWPVSAFIDRWSNLNVEPAPAKPSPYEKL